MDNALAFFNSFRVFSSTLLNSSLARTRPSWPLPPAHNNKQGYIYQPIFLLSGLTIPKNSFCYIFLHSSPCFIQIPYSILRYCNALINGFGKPFKGFFVILSTSLYLSAYGLLPERAVRRMGTPSRPKTSLIPLITYFA